MPNIHQAFYSVSHFYKMSSQPSTYVTLISNDGFEFIVSREAACVAGTIKKMLDPQSNFAEAVTGRCKLSTVK